MKIILIGGDKMKKLLIVAGIMFLVACGGSVEPDYTTEGFEKALNDGEDLEGKIVKVEVNAFEPDSAFGYNLQAGEHLNFISSSNPKLDEGDELTAEVKEVENVLGSFVISYKKK